MATLSYSNTFSNIQPTDFILRTLQSSQNLAIGNGGGSNVNAGLYVQQNSIGFRAPPKASLVLDCMNALEVNEQSNVMIPTQLNCLQGIFSNLQLSSNGILNSKNLKTESISGLIDSINIGNDSNTTIINIATSPIPSKEITIGNGQTTSILIGKKPTDTVNLNGQTMNIQTDVFNVIPKTIRMNATGLSNTSDLCGIDFIENNTSLGYFKTSSNRGGFNMKPPNGQDFLIDTTNNRVSFQSNKLVIANNGNIGIATTTPDTLLTVNGDAKITNNLQSTTATINTLISPTFSSSNAAISNLSIVSTTVSNATMIYCQANTVEFQQPMNANGRLILFKRGANDHEISSIGYSNSLLKVQLDATNKAITFNTATSSTSSSELMRISGNGNVGIGTSNPQQKLDVNGDVSVSNILYASVLRPSRTSNLTIEPANMTSWVTLNKTNKNGGITMFDKHVFTGTGISLGNSTLALPTYTLQVSGYSILENATLSNDTAYFYINPLSGDNASKTLLGEHIYYDTQDDKYVVLSDGTNASFGAMTANKGSVSFYTGNFPGQTANYDIAGSNFQYLEKMYIGENVGIGTNTPQSKLHISGNGTDNKIKVSTQSNFEASFTLEDETGYAWTLARPGNKQNLKLYNSQRDVAYIMPNGNVGIGSTFENISTEALLHVQDTQQTSNVFYAGNPLGSVRFTANGKLAAFTSTNQKYFEATNNVSDRRLKTNIVPIRNALTKTESLDGVFFNFTPETGLGVEKQIGCIAQDVYDIIPEVVEIDEDSGYYSMHYEKLVPLLIESIKELSQKVKEQETDILDLKNRISRSS